MPARAEARSIPDKVLDRMAAPAPPPPEAHSTPDMVLGRKHSNRPKSAAPVGLWM